MCSVSNKRSQALGQRRHFFEDDIRTELFTAISFDDSIRVLEVPFDARAKHIGHEGVGRADSPATSLVFICGTNPAQRCADLFVTEPLFAGVVQRSMIRKDQMRARAVLHALWRHLNTL